MEAKGNAQPWHCELFKVTLEKSTDCPKLGLELGLDLCGRLKITAVKRGLVEIWNKSSPATAVKQDDYIMEVNGIKGNSIDMLQEIKTSSILDLRIWSAAKQAGKDEQPSDAPPEPSTAVAGDPCTLAEMPAVTASPSEVGKDE